MSQHLVTLLLGSNLGDTKKNLEICIAKIKKEIGIVIKESSFSYSDPVEFVSNNIFCNIALIIKTQFSPIVLLRLIKNIERDMGREKDTVVSNVYTDRIVDIDIVMFGNLRFNCNKLHIPHQKHIYERAFSGKLLDELTQH